MNPKHFNAFVEMCLVLAKQSNCPRRKFGALLVDPNRNTIIATGYNGAPRGGGALCGGTFCEREHAGLPSGVSVEKGCHHAEVNAICNAAANGTATAGAWLIVNGEPCLMCAKVLHHAGVTKVIVVEGGYVGVNGCGYLVHHGVEVECIAGPKDER